MLSVMPGNDVGNNGVEVTPCPPEELCCTLGVLPQTSSMLGALPLAVISQPLALETSAASSASSSEGGEESDSPVPTIPLRTGVGIVRCRNCRAYINPYVQWLDGCRQWRCNLCAAVNKVSIPYYSPVDPTTGQREDIRERLELTHGCVEFEAPGEYSARTPMIPTYVFVLDVSHAALTTGFFAAAVAGLASWFSQQQQYRRVRVGLVTFDSAVHFYDLKTVSSSSGSSAFRMYALSDVAGAPATVEAAEADKWPMLPAPPSNFLVPLTERSDAFAALLAALPAMFPSAAEGGVPRSSSSSSSGVAFGPAVLAARRLCKRWGGRIVTFLAGVPSLGPGAVTGSAGRGNGSVAAAASSRSLDEGAPLCRPLEGPAGEFYKMLALDAAAAQTGFDLFVATGGMPPSQGHKEAGTLAQLAQFSGGVVHGYPNFYAEVDGPALGTDIAGLLGQGENAAAAAASGWEGILRLRTSEGLDVALNYGSMYVRLPNLLILPASHRSMAYTTSLKYTQGTLPQGQPYAYVQSALLYTNGFSRRVVRVSTIRVPVASAAPAVFAAIDTPALVTFLAKSTLEAVAYDTTITAARKALYSRAADILRQYARACCGGGGGIKAALSQLPDALATFPLYVLSLLKHPALVRIAPDERACIIAAFRSLPPKAILEEIHPQLYDLGEIDLAAAAAAADSPDAVAVPPLKALTAASLNQESVMLFNCGSCLLFYIGRNASRDLLTAIFGSPAVSEVVAQVRTVPNLQELHPDEDPAKFALNTEVRKLMNAFAQVREYVGLTQPRVLVTNNAKLVQSLLVADHTGDFYSYQEFITKLQVDIAPSF